MSELKAGKPSLTEMVTKKVTRRAVLKTTGAAALGGLAVASLPKASRTFAAPAVLQGTPLTLRYMTWFWWEPGRQDAWRYMVKKFNDSQTALKVEEAGWPFNEFTNKLIVQLQSGKIEADIIQTTPDLGLRLMQAEQLTSVQDVVDSLGITTLSQAHDNYRIDGQVYGLDVVTAVFGLFYNSTTFEKAGITTLPTTVEEWLDVSTRLTNRPNQFGMHGSHLLAEPESFWFQLQEWAMPYDGVWAQGPTPMVTSAPIVNAIKLFKQFYDATFPQGSNDTTATRQWADQQIAQQLIVSPIAGVYHATAPQQYETLRSYTLPWTSKRSIQRIHPITVYSGGEHVEESKEFLKFLFTPENYRELLTKGYDTITAYDVGGLEEYYASLKWNEGFQDMTFTTPKDVMGDFITANQEFGQIVINRVTEVLTANRPAEDAMGDAQRELEELAGRLE